MTASACVNGTAQLVVAVDGVATEYAGVIDAGDFAFVGPDSASFTLAKDSPQPEVSGGTFTVSAVELVGITTDDKVTASGSVTCP